MKRTIGVVVLVATLVLTTMGSAVAQSAPRDIEAGCPDSRVTSAGFTDTGGSAFATEIDCVVWWQIASGRSASSYGPDLSTNRAQMATFFANLIRETGGELPDNPPSAFGDTAGSVHGDNIDALAAIGVVAGTTATTYSPSRAVSREQMATFIFRTYEHLTGEELVGDQDFFGDDDGSVHENAINAIAQVGITGGDAAGDFRPKGEVTRGAMAAFLARTLDLLVDTGFADPPPLPDAVLGTDLSRVASGGECSIRTTMVTIDGQLFEQAQGCSLRGRFTSGGDWTGWEEYNLGREYDRFRATIGQSDDSRNPSRIVRYRLSGDGNVLFTDDVAYGRAVEVDVDISDVLRLRLEMSVIEGRDDEDYYGGTDAYWAQPTVGG